MPNQYGLPTEEEEQIALFEWAAYIPELSHMFAVPNGGKRGKFEALRLKRQGVRAGVPDLMLPLPKGDWHGLFIEMKVGRNKTSKEQQDYLAYLASVGYATAVCYGFEQAKNTILNYLAC